MGLRLLILVAFLAVALPVEVGAGQEETGPRNTGGPSGAYYEFLLGRYLENEGKIDEAVAAFERAARLDPSSADVPAEIAALYARNGRFREAVAAAQRALALEPANVDAHKVLGSIFASLAESREEGPAREDAARRAIRHLEQGRRSDGTDFDAALDLALGRLYLLLDRPEDAVVALDRLIASQPEIGEAHVLLARAETALGRPERAAQVLESAASANPRLLSTLADLFERQHKWTDAARTYERLAALHPASADVKLRWATALLQAGDQDSARRARDLLVEVTSAAPTDARAQYLRSNAERRVRDYEAAEQSARRVMALDPDGWTGPLALAQIFADRHEYARVVETLTPVVTRLERRGQAAAPDLVTLLAHLGLAQLRAGQGEAAVKTFQQAGRATGDPSRFAVSLVQAHLLARQYDRAVAAARAARRGAGGDEVRLFQLEAQALTAAGRHDRAVVVMRDALAAHDDSVHVHLALADVLDEAGRRGEADRVLDTAAARFPDDLLVPFQRAALLERRAEYAEAEAEFRRVLARDPLHAPALNYLGYMLAERGDRLEEAVSLVERALAQDPDNPSYLDSLGWAFYQQRQYARAEPLLRRAAERLPANSVVQDHLGDLLWALGRDDEARDAWQRAMAGDRDSVDLEVIERKVRRRR